MSDEHELKLLNLDWHEAMRLDRASKKGDPEALAFFADVRSGKGQCLICGANLEDDEGVAMIVPDPGASELLALIGRQCVECNSLTWQVRAHKLIKLFKAMYPGWHVARGSARPAIRR